MGFYRKILEHRRLAALLLSLFVAHLLIVALAVYLVILFQQFWAIPAVLWLPLIVPSFRQNARWLQAAYASRNADLLSVNGVIAEQPAGQNGEVLSNVCEEIALSMGCPQPRVAVCQSEGINAFFSMTGESAADSTDFSPGSSNDSQDSSTPTIVFTSAMAGSFNRHELQAVAADLYAHRRGFDRLFFTMAGAMYLAAFVAADIFLVLNTLQWHFGATDEFSTGPLVVILSTGMLAAPLVAARLAQMRVMRKSRYLDDLEAVETTKDAESMVSALGKAGSVGALLIATYNIENSHCYFTGLNDPDRKFPWQRLATHPGPGLRAKAIAKFTGSP